MVVTITETKSIISAESPCAYRGLKRDDKTDQPATFTAG